LSQTEAHPFAIANLVAPALEGIVRAIAGRGGQTPEDQQAKADQTLVHILAFHPRDVVELTLAGQVVLFNEALADSARDLLHGMDGKAKPRAISGLISMGRLLQGHLDRLEQRGNQPHRAASDQPEPEQPQQPQQPEVTASRAEPAKPPRPVAEPTSSPDSGPPAATAPPFDPTLAGRQGATKGQPVADTSWLDEPYEQWLVETPADLARQAGLLPAMEASPGHVSVADPDNGVRYSTTDQPARRVPPADQPARERVLEDASPVG
jgi:hypothetical protein